MSQLPKINFPYLKGIITSIEKSVYKTNNALAMLANVEYDDGYKEQVAISVNLAEESPNLPDGQFYAKNYSEGYPIFSTLIAAGWIETTGKETQSGYVTLPVCQLTDKAVIR